MNDQRLTGVLPRLVLAALGEGAVWTSLFHFHDASAGAAGKHTGMLLYSCRDRETERKTKMKGEVAGRQADVQTDPTRLRNTEQAAVRAADINGGWMRSASEHAGSLPVRVETSCGLGG